MDSVPAPAKVDVGDTVALFAAEDSDKAVLIGHDCAVEYPCYVGEGISADNGVLAVSPHGSCTVRRLFLPRDSGQIAAYQFDIRHMELLKLKLIVMC